MQVCVVYIFNWLSTAPRNEPLKLVQLKLHDTKGYHLEASRFKYDITPFTKVKKLSDIRQKLMCVDYNNRFSD